MRITAFFLLAFALHVSARLSSQLITYAGDKVPLEKIFTVIEQQTGFTVLYNPRQVKRSATVKVTANQMPLQEFLREILKNNPLQFSIKEETIVISGKTEGLNPRLTLPTLTAPPVTGIVRGPDGQPLSGVNVVVKGTKKGITTNKNGEFSIDAKENDVLVISSIGFNTKDVTITSLNAPLIVALDKGVSQLDEVQYIAYGTQIKRLQTGNVSTVRGEDIAKQPVNNPLLALSGRVPGLEISQASGLPGSGIRIRIQGTNSLTPTANEPFYVVDGVPFPSTLLPSLGGILGFTSINSTGNPFNFINPGDIESIDVLKDASATAIYGSRAANGAILVTTKKGKAGRFKVTASIQSGVGQVAKKMNLLSTEQYLDVRREAFANDGVDFITTFPWGSQQFRDYYAYDLFVYDQHRYTDWQEVLIGNSARYNDVQLSISGGTSQIQYLVAGTWHKETTVFSGDHNDQKGALHFNLNGRSDNQKFKFTLSGNYMQDHNNLSNRDLTGLAMELAPNAPSLYNTDGSLNWGYYTIAGELYTSFSQNPLAAYNALYRTRTNNLIGNANLSYEILPGLDIRSSLGFNKLHVNEITTEPSTTVDPLRRPTHIRAANYNTNEISSWIIEPQLTYNYSFGEAKLSALLGTSIQQTYSDAKWLRGEGYNNDLVLENINAAQKIIAQPGGTIISEYKYNALFGRLNYNWADKYIAELTARRDGSSRFGGKNRFYNFWAVGGAWIFSEEKFIKNNIRFLSFGKLRVSYGTTGNDQIGDYRYMDIYSNNNPEIAYAGSAGLLPLGLPNPYLQWEKNRKFSTGLDLGFAKDRLLLNATYYRNRSGNQLTSYALPPSVGFSQITSNFPALIQNSGWELSFIGRPVVTKNLIWTTSINLTVPQNKLIDFPNLENSAYASDLVIGSYITYQKLFNYIGIDPQTGVHQYLDKDEKIVSRPGTVTGNDYLRMNTAQLLFGGFQNNVTFKGFSLDILFQYVKQNGKNYYYGNGNSETPGRTARNQPVTALDRWQKVGDERTFAKYTYRTAALYQSASSLGGSTAAWKDASFVRLKNVSLSWQLPGDWISPAHMQSARVFFQGQNLLTITNYIGLDPETRSSSSLPPLRVITAGIQVTL